MGDNAKTGFRPPELIFLLAEEGAITFSPGSNPDRTPDEARRNTERFQEKESGT